MKTTLQRNLFIALISLGLLGSTNAAQQTRPISDIAKMFVEMIMDEIKTVEDACDKLKAEGREKIAEIILMLSNDLEAICIKLNFNPETDELTIELSNKIRELLGSKKKVFNFIGTNCLTTNPLTLAREFKKVQEILDIEIMTNLKKTEDERDLILHKSLLRRRKNQTTTVVQIHIDENINFNNETGNHNVHVEGDLIITDTITPSTENSTSSEIKRRNSC